MQIDKTQAYVRDKNKYAKDWSDEDCPITREEADAYSAGWHDGWDANQVPVKPVGISGNDRTVLIDIVAAVGTEIDDGHYISAPETVDAILNYLKPKFNAKDDMPVKYYQLDGKGPIYAVYGSSSINFVERLLSERSV